MKQYLSRSKVNVSADILRKAIVLPEEGGGERKYPRVSELLFRDPFPKEKKKKGKKSKKGKKK